MACRSVVAGDENGEAKGRLVVDRRQRVGMSLVERADARRAKSSGRLFGFKEAPQRQPPLVWTPFHHLTITYGRPSSEEQASKSDARDRE